MASRFDYRHLQTGLHALAKDGGKSKLELCRTAAKGFVKDVVSITPPASKGTTGTAAKKAGETAIAADIAKLVIAEATAPGQPGIFVEKRPPGRGAGGRFVAHDRPTQIGTHPVLERGQLIQFHKDHVRRGDVRIARDARGIARAVDIVWLTRTVQKLVGHLAAGWNAGAAALAVKLPAWVKRHGSRYGEHKITITPTVARIELSNTVGFVGDVKAYDRRVQYAITHQGRKMERQADALLKKRLRAAGF